MWQDSKIDCICRMNRWNKLIFLHVDTDSQKLKADQKFIGWAWGKMGVASLVTGLQNLLYLKNEIME